MSDTAVVWFRDDLRVHDNETLAGAVAGADRVVPLYVFDPRVYGEGMFGLPKKGPYWARFRRESVLDLRSSLRARGGDLPGRHGDPREVVPEVTDAFGADAVHAQTKPATEDLATENAVRGRLAEQGVELNRSWTHTFYHLTGIRDVSPACRPEAGDESAVLCGAGPPVHSTASERAFGA